MLKNCDEISMVQFYLQQINDNYSGPYYTLSKGAYIL